MADIFEYEDLARHLCGVQEDDEDTDLDAALLQEFNVDFEDFARIAAALLPLVTVARSSISGQINAGFGIDGRWIVKGDASEKEPAL